MEEERKAEPIDIGTIELPGLEQFIKDNDGDESAALKALWFQWKREMDWKAYAIGANKSIMKLFQHIRTIVPMVRDACGELTRLCFKDMNGQSLEFNPDFQRLISLGMSIKEDQITENTIMRHVRKITSLETGKVRVTYDECDHTEDVDTTTLQVGDKVVCPTCHTLMDTMQKTT